MSLHRWSLLCAAALAALALGCCSGSVFQSDDDGGPGTDGAAGGDGGNKPHKLAAIYVSPLNKVLEVDLNKPSSQLFTATGAFQDGKQENLSARVKWHSSNPQLGAFAGSTLKVPARSKTGAAVTRITATYQGLTGKAQLTVVSYRRSGPKTDFFFILPFQHKSGKQAKPLDFRTDVRSLDVFFAMDVTGSMSQEIKNLQQGLKSVVVPGVSAQVPGTQFGAGAFMDFPISPYGKVTQDQPFVLFQTITGNIGAVQNAVNKYSTSAGKPIGNGADLPESTLEALFQISTGQGLNSPPPTKVLANHSGVGGVGFRKGSMPVVLTVTDAMFHAPGEKGICSSANANYTGAVGKVAHTRQQTKDALKKICARVVGIAPQMVGKPQCSGLYDLEDFARTSGAVVPPDTWDVPSRPPNCPAKSCCTGVNGAGRPTAPGGLCPLVFETTSSGTGLSASVVGGIKMLARFAPFDVTTQVLGQHADTAGKPLPAGKNTAHFIKSVKPKSFKKPPPPPKLPDPSMDAKGFKNVSPGTTVTFTVEAFNDLVKTTSEARIFRATIKVLAGSCTDLDQREVFILVPPAPIIK